MAKACLLFVLLFSCLVLKTRGSNTKWGRATNRARNPFWKLLPSGGTKAGPLPHLPKFARVALLASTGGSEAILWKVAEVDARLGAICSFVKECFARRSRGELERPLVDADGQLAPWLLWPTQNLSTPLKALEPHCRDSVHVEKFSKALIGRIVASMMRWSYFMAVLGEDITRIEVGSSECSPAAIYEQIDRQAQMICELLEEARQDHVRSLPVKHGRVVGGVASNQAVPYRRPVEMYASRQSDTLRLPAWLPRAIDRILAEFRSDFSFLLQNEPFASNPSDRLVLVARYTRAALLIDRAIDANRHQKVVLAMDRPRDRQPEVIPVHIKRLRSAKRQLAHFREFLAMHNRNFPAYFTEFVFFPQLLKAAVELDDFSSFKDAYVDIFKAYFAALLDIATDDLNTFMAKALVLADTYLVALQVSVDTVCPVDPNFRAERLETLFRDMTQGHRKCAALYSLKALFMAALRTATFQWLLGIDRVANTFEEIRFMLDLFPKHWHLQRAFGLYVQARMHYVEVLTTLYANLDMAPSFQLSLSHLLPLARDAYREDPVLRRRVCAVKIAGTPRSLTSQSYGHVYGLPVYFERILMELRHERTVPSGDLLLATLLRNLNNMFCDFAYTCITSTHGPCHILTQL